MMFMSMASGSPLDQLRRKMSAGWDCKSESCMGSPLKGQGQLIVQLRKPHLKQHYGERSSPHWWLPKISAVSWHLGQGNEFLWRGTPSHSFKTATKLEHSKVEGTTFSQSPDLKRGPGHKSRWREQKK